MGPSDRSDARCKWAHCRLRPRSGPAAIKSVAKERQRVNHRPVAGCRVKERCASRRSGDPLVTELSAYMLAKLREGEFTLSRGIGDGLASILLVAPAGEYPSL